MNDNEFDDSIKNRLKAHESSVPADMWERIAGDETERRPVFGLRFYGLLLLLLALCFSGSYFLWRMAGKNKKEEASENASHNQSSGKSANKSSGAQITSSPVAGSATSVLNESRASKTVVLQEAKGQTTFQIQTKPRSFANHKSKKQKHHYNPGRAARPTNGNVTGNNRSSESMVLNDENKNDSLRRKQAETKKTTPTDSSETAATKTAAVPSPKILLELYAAPVAPFNDISSTDKSYGQVLKQSGHMQLSYAFGARMVYKLSERLSAKVGVQYMQVNEKIDFADSIRANKFTSANRYGTVALPWLINYKVLQHPNLNLSVSTGAVITVYSQYKGQMPSIFGQAVDLKSGQVYNTNVSTNLYFGIDASKEINKQMDLFIESWFSYRLGNMANRFYMFNQKIHTAGLSLGVRWRLFRQEVE